MRDLGCYPQAFELKVPFVIAGRCYTTTETLQVRVRDGEYEGRGEAVGVDYRGETPATMQAQIEQVRTAIENGANTQDLLDLLPAGGARCALDAALLDLEAKQSGVSVASRFGLKTAEETALSFGLQPINQLLDAIAAVNPTPAVVKIKADATDPMARIAAVHAASPVARIIVDPNQSWSVAQLQALAPDLAGLGVVLLEQPIAVGAEPELDGWTSPIPLAADELIQDLDDLEKAVGRFQFVNIKLDKIGGLTAALDLADRAEALELGLMVGCMVGSSLSMAPALLLASRCAFVDLDGPALQAEDLPGGFVYEGGRIKAAVPGFWG